MNKAGVISTCLMVLTIFSALAGIITLLPYAGAGDVNTIGYKSLCTFTPVSTIICLFAAYTFYGIRKKKYTT